MSDPDKLIQIEMPQLSSGDAEADAEGATLASWLVGVGDEVELGEVIAELETDKATVELESPAAGRIAALDVAAGTEGVRPGAVLGSIESTGAPATADGESDGSAPSGREGPRITSTSTSTSTSTVPTPSGATLAASGEAPSDAVSSPRSTPLARRAAESMGVSLGDVTGSGAGGRVVEADVKRAAGVPPEAEAARGASMAAPSTPAPPIVQDVSGDAEFRTEGLSGMRKTIARRLTESKQTVPHFYLQVRISMDEVIAVRARLNAGLAEAGRDIEISVNDFIIRASALALRDVPAANVQFAETEMRIFDRVDLSVEVATESGLLTPVVRDADRLGLEGIALEVERLASLARDGKLPPDQCQGGTFTISNLGLYGIDTVYPILNPPQACILGVGAAEEEPVVRKGEIMVGRRAAFTLAADHRAVDGAVGAQFLAALRARLEDPMGMML